MLFRFVVESTGAPVAFQDGGDWYAPGPLHYTWLVEDGAGAVECDLRARPVPLAGGGGAQLVTLARGERHEIWLAPQTGCDALTRPGRHHVRVVRILTVDERAPAGCATILVPDTTVEPIDDRGVALAPECAAFLLAAPAIASELDIDVLPYDADAVRSAITAELADTGEQHGHALDQYATWLAYALGREPLWGAPPATAPAPLAAALPERWPAPAE
jgi:hypothetical protein